VRDAKLDLDDYLPYLVNRVGVIIAEQFGAETLARHGLSIAMWRVMAVLSSAGAQRQVDLAGLTSIDVSTLSRIVTRLTQLGLLARSRSASSNREVTVMLSAAGAALVATLIPRARAIAGDAAAGLAPEDLAIMKRCLRRIYSNMKNRLPSTVAVERIGSV